MAEMSSCPAKVSESLGPCCLSRRRIVCRWVVCYFDETMEAPQIIRLHFVQDEGMKSWCGEATPRCRRAATCWSVARVGLRSDQAKRLPHSHDHAAGWRKPRGHPLSVPCEARPL